MGVRGLTAFVDNHPHLLHDHKLCDTKLVIDGSNFYFFIYLNMNLRHQFGGDYDLFALRCRQVFKVLLDSGVEPYVVFDGAYSKDDRKLATCLDRVRKRILSSDSISRGCHGKMLPLLAYETFTAVLQEMRIHHVTCDQEADNQIVLLANKLCCPVMSNDSDFYIFDITAGYIPTDYVAFDLLKDTDGKSTYLSCQMYHIDHLVESFEGLTKANLPLAATVLGNDFTSDEGFECFFAALQLPKASTKKTVMNRGYHKLLKLLYWLASLDNPETAREQILRYVPPKLQDKLRSVVNLSVDGYRKLSEDFDLLEFFESDGATSGKSNLTGYNGSSVPAWVMAKIRNTELPVFLLNALTLHRTIHFCQVEYTPSPSAHICSVTLREILYGVLLKEDLQMITLNGQTVKRQTMVEEYDRHIKDCRKSYTEPCRALDESGPLPGLSELPSLSKGNCEALLFESLSLKRDNLADVSSTILLYISCIIFWIRNASPKVTVHDLKALILCFIFIQVKKFKSKTQNESHRTHTKSRGSMVSGTEQSDLHFATKSSTQKQLQTVEANLSKYSKPQHFNNKNVLNMHVVHGFAQFQTCLLMAKHLNKLLGCPLPDPNPADFYNGTFLYNISQCLQGRPRPDLFLSEMLVKKSPLDCYFQRIVQIILDNLPRYEDSLQSVSSESSRKGAKRQKHKHNSQGRRDADEAGDESPEESNLGGTKLVAACDLSNRFSAFSVLGDSD